MTDTQQEAVRKYQADVKYLHDLKGDDIAKLKRHGNPVIRSVGELLEPMLERHRRQLYNQQEDAQTAQDILVIASVEDILKALYGGDNK
jgi:hypothetical protein